jgi:hypothetical protein
MVEYTDDPSRKQAFNKSNPTTNELMMAEISKRVSGSSVTITGGTKKKGGFTFTV